MSSEFREPIDDDLDELEEGVLDAELDASEQTFRDQFGTELAELVEAPAGLASRTAVGVGDALLTRSTLAAALDVLGTGWHTLRLLVGEPDRTSTKETDR